MSHRIECYMTDDNRGVPIQRSFAPPADAVVVSAPETWLAWAIGPLRPAPPVGATHLQQLDVNQLGNNCQ